MTRLLLIFAISLLCVGASLGNPEQSVSERFSISVNQVPLGDVLRDVGNMTGYEIRLHAPDFLSSMPVSGTVENAPLEEGLRKLLADESFVISQVGKRTIVVYVLTSFAPHQMPADPEQAPLSNQAADKSAGSVDYRELVPWEVEFSRQEAIGQPAAQNYGCTDQEACGPYAAETNPGLPNAMDTHSVDGCPLEVCGPNTLPSTFPGRTVFGPSVQ